MTIDQDMIALMDQRIRANEQMIRAAGTCVDRDTTGPGAQVVFDGSTVAMPVKALGHVFVQAGYRCVLDLYGSDWVITGSFAGMALGEGAQSAIGPVGGITGITSGSFVDVADVPSITFHKAWDATMIRICITASCYATVADTEVRFGVRLTAQDPANTYVATDYSHNLVHFNPINTHIGSTMMSRQVGIPAGAYTVQLRWRRGAGTGVLHYDSGDIFHMELDERVRSGVPLL